MDASEKPRIAEVIQHYYGVDVPTGMHGRAKIKCPIPGHQDSHASASVDHSRQYLKCFGCSVGADSFAIIMEQESVGFVEAKNLAIERGWLSGESTTPAPMAVGPSRAGRVKRRKRRR